MPLVAFREVIFDALHRRLMASFPDYIGMRAIVRNPEDPIGSAQPLPLLRCYDGGHSQTGSLAVGEVRYRLEWLVEGALKRENAAQPGTPDTEMNALQAAVIEAIMPNGEAIEIPLAVGSLEIWPEDTEFEVNRAGVADNQYRTVTFTQGFALEVTINRGMAFFETA